MLTAIRYGFATKGKTATESLQEEAGREAAQAVLAAAGDYYRCLSAWRMGGWWDYVDKHQTENPAGKAIHHFKVVGLLATSSSR